MYDYTKTTTVTDSDGKVTTTVETFETTGQRSPGFEMPEFPDLDPVFESVSETLNGFSLMVADSVESLGKTIRDFGASRRRS